MLLQRYIFRTLTKRFLVFALVLTGLSAVFALMQVSKHNQDVSLTMILSRIHLLPLETLWFTIPISVLFAAASTFGRMTADNEILAMRTGGIHPFRFYTPALVLGLLLSVLTLWLSGTVSPRAKAKGSAITKDDLRRLFDSLETSGRNEFSSDFLDLSWQSVDADGAAVTASFDVRAPELPRITGNADRLKIQQAGDDLEFIWDGIRAQNEPGTDVMSAEHLEKRYPIDRLFSLDLSDNKQLMTNRELRFRTLRDPMLGRRPGARNMLQFRIERATRISFSLACVVFALVGAVAGTLFRWGSFVGAALVTLTTVVAFYLLHLLTQHLADERAVSPALAAALPCLIVGAAGVALLVREIRR